MSNVVNMFTYEKLARIFFEKRKTSFVCTASSYLLLFVVSSFVYLLLNIPLVNMLVSITGFFVITFNYESSVIKKFASTICCFFLIAIADVFVVVFYNITDISLLAGFERGEAGALGYVLVALLAFTIATVLQKFKNIRGDSTRKPVMYWIAIIFIPFSSLVLLHFVIFSIDTSQIVATFIVANILAVNLLALYLNDILSKAYEDKVRLALHEKEKEYYFSQCQLMQESVDKMKSIRHDMKIHLGAMQGFSINGKTDDVVGYLEQLWGNIKDSEIYSNTGNLPFDSIINHKFRDVPEKKIALDMDISIPTVLDIETADVVTILGNLLSNALEAVGKVSEKWIKLNIDSNKGILIIKVDNPFDGEIKFPDGKEGDVEKIISSKRENKLGLGLKNIRKAVEKYDGEMNINYAENVFSVSVLLYVG